VTKNEIIEKTLKEIGPRLDEHEVPYSEEPDREEIVIAELQKRLPETGIKTCEDFRHLNVRCCNTCHTFYPVLLEALRIVDATRRLHSKPLLPGQ
jgi:hypothetical protein